MLFFYKKSIALSQKIGYTYKACIRRRSRKLLSYQVISAEKCLLEKGAKAFADLICVKTEQTHGGVYKVSENIVRLGKTGVRTPCTSIAKTVQKKTGGKNERTSENQNQAKSI